MTKKDWLIKRLTAYIEARLCDGGETPVNGAALAEQVGYSEAYVRELFQDAYSMPLQRYITQRRIANAAFDVLYSASGLLDIALNYGYESYDTFTRAFRRVTGCTPVEFRETRPRMERRSLGGGLFGMDMIRVAGGRKENIEMDKRLNRDEHSVVLYGVPKVAYGSYGGCTPYPICLKACANYMGEDIDYADASTGCGSAFRLTWNTESWDGGNVDVSHTYEEADSTQVYMRGVTALGRSYRIWARRMGEGEGPGAYDTEDRENARAFLMEGLQSGVPVIAMGILGPPEAGLVTGYREDGRSFLGWSMFQDFIPTTLDEAGYYITEDWWRTDNGELNWLIVMGERVCASIGPEDTARRALEVLRPRRDGVYAKGLLAYDAWAKDIANDANFADTEMWDKWLMCQGDAMDSLSDGRTQAAHYFARHESLHPAYGEAARHFQAVADQAMKMFRVLGGFNRGPEQEKALADAEKREALVGLIQIAKAEDAAAVRALEKALG